MMIPAEPIASIGLSIQYIELARAIGVNGAILETLYDTTLQAETPLYFSARIQPFALMPQLSGEN